MLRSDRDYAATLLKQASIRIWSRSKKVEVTCFFCLFFFLKKYGLSSASPKTWIIWLLKTCVNHKGRSGCQKYCHLIGQLIRANPFAFCTITAKNRLYHVRPPTTRIALHSKALYENEVLGTCKIDKTGNKHDLNVKARRMTNTWNCCFSQCNTYVIYWSLYLWL